MGNQSTEQFDNIQRFYMETSQNMAKLNALKQADKPYQFEYLGVYVMDVTTKSTFKDKLSIADTVTKIDNKRFDSTKALIKYLQTKQLGSRVEVGYEHSGKSRQTSGKMIKLANGKYGIGITLIDHTEIKSNPEIKIDAGNIGGPSAGLMFTLETYQLLSGKNLRGNLKIAGTGTMADDGEVGRIGGIDKKIATAVKNKVDVFFAPDDTITSEMKQADPKIVSNYQEALRAKKKLKTKLKIIPVKTLQDAVDYLEQQIK
jgi:PDZ domain-containing protein